MSFGVELAQGLRANGMIIGKKMQGAQAKISAWAESSGIGRSVWSVWFIWFIWLVSFNHTNETNQITIFFS
jgi:hypothetical protein